MQELQNSDFVLVLSVGGCDQQKKPKLRPITEEEALSIHQNWDRYDLYQVTLKGWISGPRIPRARRRAPKKK
jgi:hypothetical protein